MTIHGGIWCRRILDGQRKLDEIIKEYEKEGIAIEY
jgi:hypothetical protein